MSHQREITSYFKVVTEDVDDKPIPKPNPTLSKSVSNFEGSKNLGSSNIQVKKGSSNLESLKKDLPKSSKPESTLIKEATIRDNKVIQIRKGDLTTEQVDAIVNAANGGLQHGGGVAYAIQRAGGHIIYKESNDWIREHGLIPTGEVGLTRGGDLPAKYVIHAVGPVYKGGNKNEEQLLTNAVMNSLKKANELGLKSIALPAISSGIFGFPKDKCANILINTSIKFFEENEDTSLEVIRLTNFDDITVNVFIEEFEMIFGK